MAEIRKKLRGVEGKRLTRIFTLGLSLTGLVLLASAIGLTDPLERWFYDARVRYCQFFTPPPTDKLVHVDIDDRTLELVGAWPWKRAMLAGVLEEIRLAGPKAVFLDILFTDPSPFNTPGSDDDDAALAGQFQKMGNVLLPVAFREEKPPASPSTKRLQDWFRDVLQIHLGATRDQVFEYFQQAKLNVPLNDREFNDLFFFHQRVEILARLQKMSDLAEVDFAEVRRRVLPDESPSTASPLSRLLEREYRGIKAILALDRFTLPNPGDFSVWLDSLPPVELLGRAVAGAGFVDYEPDTDGVIRSLRLLKEQRRVYPQIGLALACKMLGVDVRKISMQGIQLVIPLPPGEKQSEMSIPVSLQQYPFMLLPWFGPPDAGWVVMYDHPRHQRQASHMPLSLAWEAVQLRDRIRHNNAVADNALGVVWTEDKVKKYEANLPPPDDAEARAPILRSIVEDKFIAEQIAMLAEAKKQGEKLSEDEALLLDRFGVLKAVLQSNAELAGQYRALRQTLREALQDKATLIGWTATAVAADFVPTSLHAKLPGVMVHGVVFNALMTGELWHHAPRLLGVLAGAVLGLLVTAAVAVLSPLASTLVTLLLGVSYLLFNALLLFDYGNIVLDLASPELAVSLIWAGCVAFRYVDERLSRARITSSFRNYVDPALVDYVIENPTQTTLRGEVREMTVVFTDLAGFTTMSEKLGAETVPLLNEYFGLMVPAIRRHRGYVNKFLGDGIMFFFGAPLANPRHAHHAVEAVLEMQVLLERFNQSLKKRDLAAVKMRAGVLTGEMVVGDAGSLTTPRPEDRASDFTVLGDNVNLASRLEGANKATGTLVLLAERTAELLGDRFLLRPIARLQVVGKSRGVMTYEPIALASEATEEQKQLVATTRAMITLYESQRFFECLTAADELDHAFGPCKLAELYRKSCRIHLVEPPQNFHGEIVLTEK